jgi:hypothetical protein
MIVKAIAVTLAFKRAVKAISSWKLRQRPLLGSRELPDIAPFMRLWAKM